MSLDNLLDTYLAEIEAGRATVEDCIARSPELAPLLQLAVQLRSMPAPDPSSEFVHATRARLLSLPVPAGDGAAPCVSSRRPVSRQPEWLRRLLRLRFYPVPTLVRQWQPVFIGLVAALIAIVVLGGGTVMASADAAPTSPLYPVKRAVEQAQLLLAGSPERQALLHAEFARRRLSEAVQVAALGRDDQAEHLIKEYGQELDAAVSVVERAAAKGQPVAQLTQQLRGQVEAQRSEVESVRDTLPGQVVDSALTAAGQAGNQLGDLSSQPGEAPPPTPAPSDTPVPSATPSPVPPAATPTPSPGFSIRDQQSTTVPPRSTIAPAPLPTETSQPTTLPPHNTPVIVVFSSPTQPSAAVAPTVTATQPPAVNTPRPATPTPPSGATKPKPSDTDTPEPTNTARPATPTAGPTNTKTPIVFPTPRPYTPTVAPTATQVPTIEPTPRPATPTSVPTGLPPTEPPSPTVQPTEVPPATPESDATEVVPTSQAVPPEPTATGALTLP